MSSISSFGSTFGNVPVLGYVAAAIQLVQGDIVGAAVTAATAFLMTCGPWGWEAVAVLQIASYLGVFGDDEPPSAWAGFTLDENGNVIMDIGGDDEMRE